MQKPYYNPLSDMSGIKTYLMSLFCDTEDVVRLVMPTLDNDAFSREQNWYGGTFSKEQGQDGEIPAGNPEDKTTTVTLDGHCFDTPYIKGCMTTSKCAVFIETTLNKAPNQRLKEVLVDIWVVCRKDFIRLSTDERTFYDANGIHGNRIDNTVQLIHSLLSSPDITKHIKKEFSIGPMTLSQESAPLKSYVPEDGFYGKCLTYAYPSYYQWKNGQGR